jgi:hypothetical protein
MSDHPAFYPVANGDRAPEWTGAEKLASPGFDRRTVQRIASRYNQCPTLVRTWEDAIGNSVTFPSFFLSFFLSFVHKNDGSVLCRILTFNIHLGKV